VGWVYLLSSSFSFPELLVGFPRAHPSPVVSIHQSAWNWNSTNFAFTEF
jgi:hypothetical protein